MFCSIIGHPLKNPRSIKLWKIFFKKKKLKIDMFGVDVKKSKFKKTIKNFTKNQNFLASAITMPYKKDIVKYVKINDKISSDPFPQIICLGFNLNTSEIVFFNNLESPSG